MSTRDDEAERPPPWSAGSSTVIPYDVVRESIDSEGWDHFATYYTNRRKAPIANLREIFQDLQLPLGAGVVRKLREQLGRAYREKDITGQMGEITASYVLEQRHDVLLFGITWPTNPFSVRRGTDVSGICTRTWFVVMVESKATSTGAVSSQVSKAVRGLKAKRLWSNFDLDLDDGQSRTAAVGALRHALRTNRLRGKNIKAEDVERLVSAKSFVRVGVLVHDRKNGEYDYSEALRRLEKDDADYQGYPDAKPDELEALRCLPTVFIDVRFDEFDGAVDKLVYLESVLKEGRK